PDLIEKAAITFENRRILSLVDHREVARLIAQVRSRQTLQPGVNRTLPRIAERAHERWNRGARIGLEPSVITYPGGTISGQGSARHPVTETDFEWSSAEIPLLHHWRNKELAMRGSPATIGHERWPREDKVK